MRKVYWLMPAPTMCELCKHALADTFIDGVTRTGQWACMCPACWARLEQAWGLQPGFSLGTGRGQQYTKQADGKWLKTGG